jgi:hypothetical protein
MAAPPPEGPSSPDSVRVGVILAPAAEPDWDGQALDVQLERRFPDTDWEF